jgi:tRNA modification GTPase
MNTTGDTIFALSSGAGRAGIAVIRISGPDADTALGALTGKPLPDERKAEIRTLFDIPNEERIDVGLVLRMPGPRSFTGEDVVELSVHGGRAVVGAVLASLGRVPGLRLAEPGEFTRRAVEHGRLDLTQAEAIADLVAAETDAQRRQALDQMDGTLSALYEDWRARLIRAAAWLEASIDFADEEIPPDAVAASRDQLVALAGEVRRHLHDGRRGEILREGLHVAVVGPPNAGKSSLINALARRDVAIVSDTAGTTRDVIEVRLDLGGYAVILADTAGLREANDAIEQEGVRRARARAADADIRLLVLDGAATTELDQPPIDNAEITVFNKSDIAGARRTGLNISAKTGEGIDTLVDALATAAKQRATGEGPALTRARHRHALERAHTAIASALKAPDGSPELAAESVRVALNEIGRISGRVDLDDLLDVVFRDFCIGK